MHYIILLTAEIIYSVHFFKETLWCFSTVLLNRWKGSLSYTHKVSCYCTCLFSFTHVWLFCHWGVAVVAFEEQFQLKSKWCFQTGDSYHVCTCKQREACQNCVLLNTVSVGFESSRSHNNPTVNTGTAEYSLLLRMTVQFHCYLKAHSYTDEAAPDKHNDFSSSCLYEI